MIRIQLRLKDAAETAFRAITDKLKMQPKEAVLDGLALLHFALREIGQGKEIGSFDPEKREFTAYTTPLLEGVKAGSAGRMAIPASPASPASATR